MRDNWSGINSRRRRLLRHTLLAGRLGQLRHCCEDRQNNEQRRGGQHFFFAIEHQGAPGRIARISDEEIVRSAIDIKSAHIPIRTKAIIEAEYRSARYGILMAGAKRTSQMPLV